ncbi:MAG: hypothetical protein H6658_11595 [Ardenticatenaceae bacterium]|nr:hypothetical protein [Ardenticatenaceae bacterium]
MMPEAHYQKGEFFPVQFVWRLPDGDFIRAVFKADVLDIVPAADKYVVCLRELMAGRQESATGEMRPVEELTREYWRLVGRLQGRRVTVAFECDTGKSLHMRLETLTGEHNFFFRFDPL